MRFHFHKIDKLPLLAWCAIISENYTYIDIYHGSGIETGEDFFVEGAWNGDYEKVNFEEASFFMGSGGKVDKDKNNVLFSTPSHTIERLYTYKSNQIMYVSNSMPFILYMSEEKLDDNYYNYENDIGLISKGIYNFKREIMLQHNRELEMHYFCNFNITKNLMIIESPKAMTKDFESYEQYHSSLIYDLKKLANNASDPLREKQYDMVSTISKGYDSCACASVASQIGCTRAVSFDGPGKYVDDCGKDIAENLGFTQVITKNASNYLNNESLIEAEFISSGDLGTEIIFSSFEEEFRNSMVFTGDLGDRVWDKNYTDPNREFRFKDYKDMVYTGPSLIENRLRVGYIVIYVAVYRMLNWPSMHKISNSEDMEPYSVGGNYDRPLPRRLVESRGIKREAFGQKKSGAGFNYRHDNLKRVKQRMSKNSYESFCQYMSNKRTFSRERLLYWSKYLWAVKGLYASYILDKVNIKFEYDTRKFSMHTNPGVPFYLFLWANDVMVSKYNEAEISRWWLLEDDIKKYDIKNVYNLESIDGELVD